jgi:3-phosphoshikimate 1-carboxyvinyltransferase
MSAFAAGSSARWTLRPARRIVGEVLLPGDKSISHRALIFASLSRGVQHIDGLSGGADVLATAAALRAMGADIEASGPGSVRVGALRGGRLSAPGGALDCGNSGTSMRLLAGLAAGQPFETVLTGDASLCRRPMARITHPLREMGAQAQGEDDGRLPPLRIRGGQLRGIVHHSPVASAQVKSCLLLAGLFAEGRLELHEPSLSRDHSERMLRAAGVEIQSFTGGLAMDCGQEVRLPEGRLRVARDLSAAAFFVVAASILDHADLRLPGLGNNPTRSGFLDVLSGHAWSDGVTELGEERGQLYLGASATANRARPLHLAGDMIPRLIDEIPILAILAARCPGVSRIEDAGELRAKESDRIETTAAMLRSFGVEVETRPDGMLISGAPDRPFQGGCSIDSAGDHRIAMAAAVGALVADATVEITGVEAVETSFPGFIETLESCVER